MHKKIKKIITYLTVEAQIQQTNQLSLCPIEAMKLLLQEKPNSVEESMDILKKNHLKL